MPLFLKEDLDIESAYNCNISYRFLTFIVLYAQLIEEIKLHVKGETK